MEDKDMMTIKITNEITGEERTYRTNKYILAFLSEEITVADGFFIANKNVNAEYMRVIGESLIMYSQENPMNAFKSIDDTGKREPCDDPDCLACQLRRAADKMMNVTPPSDGLIDGEEL